MPPFMQMPQTPTSEGLRTGQTDWLPPVPIIEEDQAFSEVIRELSQSVNLEAMIGTEISSIRIGRRIRRIF